MRVVANDNYLLFHADCLAAMQYIKDESIDLILCDLPYGSTSCRWDTIIPFDLLWEEYTRILSEFGTVVLFATQPFGSQLINSQLSLFKYELIWHKSKCGSSFTAKYRPLAKHENILVFGKARNTYNPQMVAGLPYSRTRQTKFKNNHNLGLGKKESTTINMGTRYPESVLFFQQKWRRQDQLHPTQKPVELMQYLIRTYSNVGQIVLDNCMGSGTTGVAALLEGRQFLGIEKDAEYFEVARKRIKNYKSERV